MTESRHRLLSLSRGAFAAASTFGLPRRVTFAGVEHGLLLLDLRQREAWEQKTKGRGGNEALNAPRATHEHRDVRSLGLFTREARIEARK